MRHLRELSLGRRCGHFLPDMGKNAGYLAANFYEISNFYVRT